MDRQNNLSIALDRQNNLSTALDRQNNLSIALSQQSNLSTAIIQQNNYDVVQLPTEHLNLVPEFDNKLWDRIHGEIRDRDVFENWMIKYKVVLAGSIILQVLYDIEWPDSDIDFNIRDGKLMEEATSQHILEKVFNQDVTRVVNKSLPVVEFNNGFRDDKCIDNRQDQKYSVCVHIGPRIQVSWRLVFNQDVCYFNYEFMRNSWSPRIGLIKDTHIMFIISVGLVMYILNLLLVFFMVSM